MKAKALRREQEIAFLPSRYEITRVFVCAMLPLQGNTKPPYPKQAYFCTLTHRRLQPGQI